MSAVAPPVPAPRLTRSEWGLLAVLTAIAAVQVTDSLLIAPLAQQLQTTGTGLGLSKREFSYCAAVYGLAAAVSGILASSVVDRFCRKRVVMVALAGLIVALTASAVAVDFVTFFFARLLAGVFGGVTACGVLAVIADAIVEPKRGKALSALGASFGIAAVVGLPVCLLARDLTGGLWAAYTLVAAVGVVVWLIAAVRLPRMIGHCRTGRASPLAEFGRVASRPNHLVALAFMMCIGLGAYTVIPFMAQYMQQNCGVPESQFKFVFLAMGLVSLAAAVLTGVANDRFGRRPVFLVLMAGMVGVTLGITNLPPVSVLVAGAVACGYMAVAVGRLVPTHAIMLSAAHPPDRGAYTTLYNSVSLLATSFGPLLAGFIVPDTPETSPIENYAVCGLVACGFSLAGVGLSFVVRPEPPAA